MPRRPDRRQINSTVSAAQYAAIQDLAGPDGIAAYIRQLIANDAKRRGRHWPDNLPPTGASRRARLAADSQPTD